MLIVSLSSHNSLVFSLHLPNMYVGLGGRHVYSDDLVLNAIDMTNNGSDELFLLCMGFSNCDPRWRALLSGNVWDLRDFVFCQIILGWCLC